MAKQADPSGQRTLGVLTKPDRVETGTFQNWKPIIEGSQQKLGHGYFVVKNPEPTRVGRLTRAQARAEELAFFEKEPWASLDDAARARLGTGCLAGKLSKLLEKIVTARMPTIIAEVKALDLKLKSELQKLPREVPDSQLLLHFNSFLTRFEKDFVHKLLRAEEEGSLAEDLYTISLNFWADMM